MPAAQKNGQDSVCIVICESSEYQFSRPIKISTKCLKMFSKYAHSRENSRSAHDPLGSILRLVLVKTTLKVTTD